MVKIVSILFLMISFVLLGADEEWMTYSKIENGYDIKRYDEIVYAATDGGLLIVSGDEKRIFDIDDGLFELELHSLERDFRNIFWLGSNSGNISLHNLETGEREYLSDLSAFGSFNLNGIYSSNQYIYIYADKALVRYKYNQNFDRYEVKDSNLKFEDVSGVAVNEKENLIYLSSKNGLYCTSETNENISDIALWNKIDVLPDGIILNTLFNVEDQIFALTSIGLFELKDSTAIKLNILEGLNIVSGCLDENGDPYLMVQDDEDRKEIYSVDLATEIVDKIYTATALTGNKFSIMDGEIYLINGSNGVYRYSLIDDEIKNYTFNLPKGKGIKKGFINNEGDLCYFFFKQGVGSRMYYFNNANLQWEDISLNTGGTSTNVFQNSDNDYYIGTWGMGVYKFEFKNSEFKELDHFNFGTTIQGSNYFVNTDIGEDSKNNMWFTFWNNNSVNTSSLVKVSAFGDTTKFKILNRDNTPFDKPYELYIDNNDWIWLGSSGQGYNAVHGLAVCKENGSSLEYGTSKTDRYGNSLGGVISFKKDKNNTVWIGTNTGLKKIDLDMSGINSPGDVNSNKIDPISSGPIGRAIYDIEISSTNEKWLATENGVSVLSGDNKTWRHYVPYNYESDEDVPGEIIMGYMLDASVSDIIFDDETKKVIFVSKNGLTYFDYSIVSANSAVNTISTNPSPFLVSSDVKPVKFILPYDGNNYDAIKILDLKGRLVLGGTGNDNYSLYTGWTGRDNDGELVSSGVYQVIVYDSEDPTKFIKGKIAVIRKK